MKTNKFLTYTIITGLLSALFIPFIIADTQLFPFISGKGFTFRILVEILLGLWVVGMFFDSSIRPKTSWITWSVVGLTVVTFLADVFGQNFYHSFWSNYERMDGFITLIHVVAYYFITSSVLNTRERWRMFFNTSVVASVIMSFYTFLQLAGKIAINQGGVRTDGTFGNATYLAVYMLLNIFITLYLALGVYERNDKNKIVWYCWYATALVFQLISIYYTQTRGAILGLIGGLILTCFGIALFERNRSFIRRIGIGALVGIVVLIGAFFALKDTNLVQNNSTLSRFASLSFQSVSTQGRYYVWPMAWQGFKDRPLLGWGQENFNHVFSRYYDPRMYNQEPWFDRAHNIVLDWLVAGGILGLAAYLSLFGSALYLLWKNKTYSLSEKSIIVGLLAGYFFQNLFVFDNLVSYIYFFSILAFIHSETVKNKSEPAWITSFAQNKTLTHVVVPAVSIVVVVALVYGLNVRQIGASRNLIRALSTSSYTPEQVVGYFEQVFEANTFANAETTDQMSSQVTAFQNPSISAETRQRFVTLLVDNLDKVIDRYPGDARYTLNMGSVRGRLGDTAGALPYLEQAREISPKKQRILFEIGLAHLNAGNHDEALAEFKAAYELDTTYSEAKLLYAIAALYAKQITLANTLVTELSADPGFFDERLISAYVANDRAADAVKILEKRVEAVPDDASLRLRLAAGYLMVGQRAKSITVLQEMLVLFPGVKNEIEFYIKEIQAGRNPTRQQ